MLKYIVLNSVFIGILNAVLYDSYSGKPATEEMIRTYKERNNLQYCAVEVKPCDPKEWRRIDGTCNNLKYPSRGAPPTPNYKYLESDFSTDYEPRNAKSGAPLPLERLLRTELLQEGKASELAITQLVPIFAQFAIDDVNSFQDVINVVRNTTYCCTEKGKGDYACTPIKIPVDDPVHRYSGVSCQNQTRPQSMQYYGCLDVGTPFSRFITVTPTFDLTGVYGTIPNAIYKLRTYKNGLLKHDAKTFKKTGQIFPIGDHGEAFNSYQCGPNHYPEESLCFTHNPNAVMGPCMITILFYRQHNYLAKKLRKLNPCWDDYLLFYTARDINIATFMQIYIYELLPVLLGKTNMIKDGLISTSPGFRDSYNETILPVMVDEFAYVHRWFHTVQDETLRLYDKDGYFLKTFPIVNGSDRTGFLANDDNLDKVLAGSYRHASGGFDYTIDFDLAERVHGDALFASDVAASDLSKGRLLGFPDYLKYRQFCTKRQHKKFDDLKDVISEERLHRLRELYKSPHDIDLLAGLWTENHRSGSIVPDTLYCLVVTQLKRSIASDRHWYERENRSHPFTSSQLAAVRKMTIAGLLCEILDGVTKIQPRAFYSIDKKNAIVSCSSSKIGKIDVTPWKDESCNKS